MIAKVRSNASKFKSNALAFKKITELVGTMASTFSQSIITADNKAISSLYKGATDLEIVFDSKSSLLNQDPLLLSFLSNAVGLNVNLCNDQLKLYQFSVIVESVYHLCNQNMILPIVF